MRTSRIYSQQVSFKAFFLLFFLLACFFSFTPFLTAASAADVTLAWDANSEDNLAGYKLYYKTVTSGASYDGTGLTEGDSPVTINIEDLSDTSSPVFSLSGLEEGTPYFFALTAFDSDGLESDYSDEVPYTAGDSDATLNIITASATGEGTISPEGAVSVTKGDSQTFTITPGDHYHIADVTVDGTPVGQITSFTFENVGTTHTISAVFEIDTYTVTATAGDNGSISPADVTSVDYGESLSYVITPDDGYHVSDVLVDGSSVGTVRAFSFENISTWHTIAAVFEAGAVGVVKDPVADDETVPDAPVADSETVAADVVMGPVELAVGAFNSTDAGVSHQKTEWQVFRTDDDLCVLGITSSTLLTTFTVPEIMLDENTSYYWNARFVDSNGTASEWSQTAYFTTGASQTDTNGDGINDEQMVDASVDLNQDGIPDAEQEIIKSIVLPATNQPIGLDIEDSETVMAILYLEAVDVDSLSIVSDVKTRIKKMPTGLINYKLEVAEPGDTAVVKIRFSEAMNPNAKWMKLDVITGTWIDYSGYSRLSDDRRSMTLELVDGGYGDDDGVANGIIVDPAGMEMVAGSVAEDTASDDTSDVEETASESADSSDSGGGCFITGSVSDDAPGIAADAGILLLITIIGGILVPVLERKRK